MKSTPDGIARPWHKCMQWPDFEGRRKTQGPGRDTQRSLLPRVSSLRLEEGRKQGRLGFHPRWIRKKQLPTEPEFGFELMGLAGEIWLAGRVLVQAIPAAAQAVRYSCI